MVKPTVNIDEYCLAIGRITSNATAIEIFMLAALKVLIGCNSSIASAIFYTLDSLPARKMRKCGHPLFLHHSWAASLMGVHILDILVMDIFSGLSDCQRQRMFVYALRRFSHATGREIASVTGRSPSAVTHVWRELQDRLTVDMTFKQQVEALARILGTETPKLS